MTSSRSYIYEPAYLGSIVVIVVILIIAAGEIDHRLGSKRWMMKGWLSAIGGQCVEAIEVSVARPEGLSTAVGCCHRRQALLFAGEATKVAKR